MRVSIFLCILALFIGSGSTSLVSEEDLGPFERVVEWMEMIDRTQSAYEILEFTGNILSELSSIHSKWEELSSDETCSRKSLEDFLYIQGSVAYRRSVPQNSQLLLKLLKSMDTHSERFAKRCAPVYLSTLNELAGRVSSTTRNNLDSILTEEFLDFYKELDPSILNDRQLECDPIKVRLNQETHTLLRHKVLALRDEPNEMLDNDFYELAEEKLKIPCKRLVGLLHNWAREAGTLLRVLLKSMADFATSGYENLLVHYKFCSRVLKQPDLLSDLALAQVRARNSSTSSSI